MILPPRFEAVYINKKKMLQKTLILYVDAKVHSSVLYTESLQAGAERRYVSHVFDVKLRF